MTTATAPESIPASIDLSSMEFKPIILPLPSTPWTPCDGHADASIAQGIFSITVAGGFEIVLCLHCARKQGFDVNNIKTWLHTQNKTQGSAS